MADFRYPKPFQKCHVLVGSKFLQKNLFQSNFYRKFDYNYRMQGPTLKVPMFFFRGILPTRQVLVA
jgi:hypothetical protein